MAEKEGERMAARGWRQLLGRSGATPKPTQSPASTDSEEYRMKPEKWSMGILNDKETDEVPVEEKKKTANGKIILEPQPEDSLNDPLNWPSWRRDIALLSLGFYCMLGGGMTPILAAGFNNVAETYNVSEPKVALTTGFYMLGLGLGSLVASPTAILFGKRPVYLAGIILFVVSSVWCAVSPNYVSLVIARIVMGIAVSPVECLPSATIAEIFFLHERAFRLGIYTLLLLGGKNLIPLVSAAIIQGLSWQWVFWIVAIVVAFCFVTVFLFVPETFWDRTPRAKIHSRSRRSTWASISGLFTPSHDKKRASTTVIHGGDATLDIPKVVIRNSGAATTTNPTVETIAQRRQHKQAQHVGFADNLVSRHEAHPGEERSSSEFCDARSQLPSPVDVPSNLSAHQPGSNLQVPGAGASGNGLRPLGAFHSDSWRIEPRGEGPKTPALHNLNSPFYMGKESPGSDYITNEHDLEVPRTAHTIPSSVLTEPATAAITEKSTDFPDATPLAYTHHLRTQPPRTFVQALRPWNGRLVYENWLKVAIRPMILFAYPAILWSAMVYALSVGWLIVLSESMSVIFRNPQYTYNFSALGTGLVYISPFIGGILGTAVAGKVSDILVRFMARRNGGIYEPEFRLIMAIPVAITTCIGLMGFGWSAAEHDRWIVPTFFFGVISFGCSLGSTTAITFAVDSYRQYAGEALVTLNISKNILHGFVFSLFFTGWLQADGSKSVFLIIGGIQLACLATTVPMYIYGKRGRMWTVRMNMMERF
ncbi:hypothetical protein MMC30_005133 [Trapelia coarctata]|nr:hypothetical protein [Trapelia coarctata]